MTNFQNTLLKIQDLTDNNDHTGAYIMGARLIGADAIAQKFELLSQLRDLEGGYPGDLFKYQYGLYTQLMDYAKDILVESQSQQFYASF